MSQNTSSAVMAQRVEPHTSLDFFPTPLWATRALCEHVLGRSREGARSTLRDGFRDVAYDPACGQGHMARPLKEYFSVVNASDVHDYGYGTVHDFLMPYCANIDACGHKADWIITNPPFRLAQQFVERASALSPYGIAMLVRTAFLEGQARYKTLFRDRPPFYIAQFSERVPMFKGRVDRKGSTATAYCWIVWLKPKPERVTTRFMWIPPCRAKLERDEDYDNAGHDG